MEYFNLQRKVKQYQSVLKNTRAYRDTWKESLKDFIREQLNEIIEGVGLDMAKVIEKSELENLEAIVLSLGTVKSGMYHEHDSIKRHMIKHSGSLVYQQLFNGKIIVVINYPYIENYGQPHPPKTVAIYRPNELKEPFFIRHVEEFITEITNWEDYDDDEPNQKIGFKFNFDQPVE